MIKKGAIKARSPFFTPRVPMPRQIDNSLLSSVRRIKWRRWLMVVVLLNYVVLFRTFSGTQQHATKLQLLWSVQSPSAKNRTLVILNGSPRCGDPAWNSLHTQLLDVNNADLALAFGESLDWNSSLYSRAKYIWEFPELEDWGEALDQMGTGWRRYRDSGNIMGGVRGSNGKITFGSGAILFWIRWFVKGKLVSEPGLLDQYDWFVYTRSDHFYYCPHDLKPFKNNSSSLYVPQGEGYGGYTDRHLVASRELIMPALSIFDDIARTDNRDEMQEGNMEQLIERRWRDMNLTVVLFPRMFFTCAKPGDKTRWMFGGDIHNTPDHIKELGIAVKYRQEYVDSANYCHEKKLDPTTSTPTDATSAAAVPHID